MTLPESYINMRHEAFQRLPISDWHQVIAFEKIIKNYIALNQAI